MSECPPPKSATLHLLVFSKLTLITYRYFGDADILDRIPKVFLLLGGIYAGMQIIGCLLITDPPEVGLHSIDRILRAQAVNSI